jgi:hypothetical protein
MTGRRRAGKKQHRGRGGTSRRKQIEPCNGLGENLPVAVRAPFFSAPRFGDTYALCLMRTRYHSMQTLHWCRFVTTGRPDRFRSSSGRPIQFLYRRMPFLAWTRMKSLSTVHKTAASRWKPAKHKKRVTGDEAACNRIQTSMCCAVLPWPFAATS